MSDETTEKELYMYFRGIGRIKDVRIIRDKASGKQRGFGFVTFHHQPHANLVIQMRHHQIRNCAVECKAPHPHEQAEDIRPGLFPTYADAWVGYNGYCT